MIHVVNSKEVCFKSRNILEHEPLRIFLTSLDVAHEVGFLGHD